MPDEPKSTPATALGSSRLRVFREEEFHDDDEGPTQPALRLPLPPGPALTANESSERARATRPTQPLPLPRPPRR